MAEVTLRARGFAPRDLPFVGAATLVVILLLWQAAASAGLISTRFLPAPLQIGRALLVLAGSGELPAHLFASLQRLSMILQLFLSGEAARA